MIEYSTTILKFDSKGEKTGWTYIEIPSDVADKLKKGFKKSFRVKGKLDNHVIEKAALLPMGNGNFILPINSSMRKGIGKKHGSRLFVKLEVDKTEIKINEELISCLDHEPEAKTFFNQLPRSHQFYFSKWIDSAKTNNTKAERIALAIQALQNRLRFSEMLKTKKR